MTIREKMKECGNGLCEIKISELVYVGSYGMMGYTKYTVFELIIKDKNIYSKKIYKIKSYDKNNEIEILDKFEKIKLVNDLLNLDCDNKIVTKFEYKLLENKEVF